MLGSLLVLVFDAMDEPGPPANDAKSPVAPHHIGLGQGVDGLWIDVSLSYKAIDKPDPSVLSGSHPSDQPVPSALDFESVYFRVSILKAFNN